MKNKILSVIFCLILVLNLTPSASAAMSGASVIDEADLFAEKEHIKLENLADTLTQTYGMDVFIVTVDTLDGQSAVEYAESLYTDGGLQRWDSEHTILFLLAMEEREWYISTGGDAIYVFTDYGLEELGNLIIPYLSEGEYFKGFEVYLEALPEYFNAYQNGEPIDGYAQPQYREDVVYYEKDRSFSGILATSLLIGFIAAVISILMMAYSMNTKRKQHSAADYLKQGSYHLRTHQDIYLYSNISKVRRQQNSSSSGGSGHRRSGGSSVHRSSGGRRHGGRGGRF